MIDDLVKNKKVIKDDGALISAEDVDPKVLITKSDGSYLYITTDLATILYRQKIFHMIRHFILLIIDNLCTLNNYLIQSSFLSLMIYIMSIFPMEHLMIVMEILLKQDMVVQNH
jgi:hypothetical protein